MQTTNSHIGTMPSRVIYLFPTELEAHPFRVLRPDAEVVISGVGMAATSAAIASLVARSDMRGARLLLCGIAGSYIAGPAVGEVVEVSSELCTELPERFRVEYRNTPCTKLRSVRSATVHRTEKPLCGVEIENMEGAALFALAEAMGIRVAEIRAVSNRVGEPFAEWRVEEAIEALADVLSKLEVE